MEHVAVTQYGTAQSLQGGWLNWPKEGVIWHLNGRVIAPSRSEKYIGT